MTIRKVDRIDQIDRLSNHLENFSSHKNKPKSSLYDRLNVFGSDSNVDFKSLLQKEIVKINSEDELEK